MARKGLPAKYAKMGFKKGWKAYKASKKKTSRTRKASPPRRKGGRKTMARRKKRRGGKSIANTAMKWIRIGALAAPAVSRVFEPIAL